MPNDQLLAFMAENPSHTAEVVASLYPPIADRISKVFPGADPNVLESARIKFIDNLVEILPDPRNSDHDDSFMEMFEILLGSLIAEKISVLKDEYELSQVEESEFEEPKDVLEVKKTREGSIQSRGT